MERETQVFYHHLTKYLGPLLEQYIDDVREKHGKDWLRHFNPLKPLLLPAMEYTIRMVRHWDALPQAERDAKMNSVLDFNAGMRAVIAQRLAAYRDGDFVTDPVTGVQMVGGVLDDMQRIAEREAAAESDIAGDERQRMQTPEAALDRTPSDEPAGNTDAALRSIHVIMNELRAHPDYVFGTVFTTSDFEDGDAAAAFDGRYAEERLAGMGNEIIAELS